MTKAEGIGKIDLAALAIEDNDLLILRVDEQLRPEMREVAFESVGMLRHQIHRELGKRVLIVLLEPGMELTRVPNADLDALVALVRDEVLRDLAEQMKTTPILPT